ncbi:hypothetical protein MBLNU459_g2420t1 [Dothideomycetes sp. NU459]
MNAVEDETGDVDRIAVYSFNNSLPPHGVLPQDALLAIKEPYYKISADGSSMLRVDHPSDLVPLDAAHNLVPEVWRAVETNKTAIDWKDEGNAALSQKEYAEAYRCYTKGLSCLTPETSRIRRDLHRNRSLLGLILGRYDEAKVDAQASISGGTDAKAVREDVKALYRAARADYQLGSFTSAQELLNKLLTLAPTDEDGKRELKRVESRLYEERGENLDFATTSKTLARTKYHPDHADFTALVSVRQSTNKGRGLFATCGIASGDIIMCEKAFAAVHQAKDSKKSLMLNIDSKRGFYGTHAKVWADSVQKIFNNPSLTDRISDLHAGSYAKSKSLTGTLDGLPVVDTFLVQAIVEQNSFEYVVGREPGAYRNACEASELPGSHGLWCTASYINHSCVFNAQRSFLGDIMVLRATRDIAPDEEITLPYCSVDEPLAERQKLLKQTWGFECDCRLCVAEATVTAAQSHRRASLCKSAERLLQNNILRASTSPDMNAVTKVNTLVSQIEGTYPQTAVRDLPRLAAVAIQLWLCQAYRLRGMHQKVIDTARALLRNCGYILVTSGYEIKLDRANGILTIAVVDALMYMSEAETSQGSKDIGKGIAELGREMYQTINGEPTGFDSRY